MGVSATVERDEEDPSAFRVSFMILSQSFNPHYCPNFPGILVPIERRGAGTPWAKPECSGSARTFDLIGPGGYWIHPGSLASFGQIETLKDPSDGLRCFVCHMGIEGVPGSIVSE